MPPTTPPPASPPKVPPVPPPNLSVTASMAKEAAGLLDSDEQLVTIVHRHPIGIVGYIVEVAAGVIAILALIFLLSPDTFRDLFNSSSIVTMAIVVLAVFLIILILTLAIYVYRQSKLFITDQNLIQIIQRGLFMRKVSRLSMSNVEDVNGAQNGFLATVFGYGTLTVQTAGEMENFIFKYCPNPDSYAQQILEARQLYAQHLQEDKEP